jgi:hypothetical protein
MRMVWSIARRAGCRRRRERHCTDHHHEHDNINTESDNEEFEPLAARADVREDSPLFADLGVDERIVQPWATSGSPGRSPSRR